MVKRYVFEKKRLWSVSRPYPTAFLELTTKTTEKPVPDPYSNWVYTSNYTAVAQIFP
jgi:hypothetical protein